MILNILNIPVKLVFAVPLFFRADNRYLLMRQHTVNTPYMVGEAHFYTTEIEGDLVLFDTGPATAEAWAFLQGEVDLARLRYLFVTHCHVDHYGLAAHIALHGGAEIFIPRKDAVKLRRHEERIGKLQSLLVECGFDEGFVRRLRKTFDDNKVFPVVPERYTVLEESPVPEQLGITWMSCPGHSQTDIVYGVGAYAVTGDILLKNIFQAPLLDVDLETFSGRFRNYDAYCDTLLKLPEIRGCTILPGHRRDVSSLDETILFYVRKLLERAIQVARYAETGTVRGVIGELFGGNVTDPFLLYLKASEIMFMRDFLAEPGRLRRSLEAIGLLDAVSEQFGGIAGGGRESSR